MMFGGGGAWPRAGDRTTRKIIIILYENKNEGIIRDYSPMRDKADDDRGGGGARERHFVRCVCRYTLSSCRAHVRII